MDKYNEKQADINIANIFLESVCSKIQEF